MPKIYYFSENGNKLLEEINDEKYLQILEAIRFVKFYKKFEELFDILHLNFSEIWNFLLMQSEYFRLNNLTGYDDLNRPTLIANLKLNNLLTSFRLFDDHLRHKLSEVFGKSKQEFSEYENITSKCYDSYFEYRFFYGLRDYAQHFNLPIGSIQPKSGIQDGQNGRKFYSIDFYLIKDELLKDKIWKAQLREEILHLTNNPSLVKLLNKFNYLTLKVYQETRDYLLPAYNDNKKLLLDIYKRCLSQWGDLPEFYNHFSLNVWILGNDSNGDEIEYWLPIELINISDKLKLKHDINPENLNDSYTFLGFNK